MKYFNGFALQGEERFLKSYLIDSDFCLAGFSYGAQKAFEYAYNTDKRIDRLLLLSPAFFQHHKTSFIRTQLRYFRSNQQAYIQQFLKNVAYPSSIDLEPYLTMGKHEELEFLLGYIWDREKMMALQKRGVTIEVFIGGKDKIVNVQKSFEFFSEISTTYYFKEQGHLLI